MKISNPYSVEHLNVQLKKLVKFLTPWLPLTNGHLVQFYSQDQWNNFLPSQLQQDLLNVPYDKLNFVSTAELQELSDDICCNDCKDDSSLQHFLTTVRGLRAENLNILSSVSEIKFNFNERDEKILESSMNLKKCHEVKHLCQFIVSICEDKNPDWIVDVGSGLGYLSSALLIQHKLKVFALDSSRSNIFSSLKHSQKLFERFENIRPSSGKSLKRNHESNGQNDSDISEDEKCLSFNEFEGKFLGLTKYITKDDNLPELMTSLLMTSQRVNISDCNQVELGLVGLHTCGNLSPTSAKLFVNNPSVRFVCNIGCCYHLLREEFCEDYFVIERKNDESRRLLDGRYHCPELDPFHRKNEETLSLDPGFPLCSYLRSIQFCLGRNARDLAAKPSNKVSIKDKNLEPLFWRALFEQLVTEIYGSWPDGARVGRKVNKGCSNFHQYCRRSFASIGLAKLSEKEVYIYYQKHKSKKDQMVRFLFLKTCLAPLIETLINLDRLIYLLEQGFTNSHLIQIFDSKISPRNTAVVSFK